MHWLTEISPWHWASLGIILLILETLGTAGFLIGSAIAAFLMTILLNIVPDLNWKWQLAIFSSSAVVFSIIYLKNFATFNEDSDQPNLNNRAALHIGKKFTLDEAIENGQGRIQIGDTFWKVSCDEDLGASTKIQVTDATGMTLVIKSIEK